MKKLIITLSLFTFINSAYADDNLTAKAKTTEGMATPIEGTLPTETPAEKANIVTKNNDKISAKTEAKIAAEKTEVKTENTNHIIKQKLHKGEEGICNTHDKVCITDMAKRKAKEGLKDGSENKAVESANAISGETKN
jgi:hypothetical protein